MKQEHTKYNDFSAVEPVFFFDKVTQKKFVQQSVRAKFMVRQLCQDEQTQSYFEASTSSHLSFNKFSNN